MDRWVLMTRHRLRRWPAPETADRHQPLVTIGALLEQFVREGDRELPAREHHPTLLSGPD
jgi:hypothetical protein